MVNEDIVTSLRNAVERGENLENAMRMLINSGYPPSEVQDASKFVGFVPMSDNENILNTYKQKNVAIKNISESTRTLPPKLPPQSQLQQIQQFSNQNPRYPLIKQLPQRIATTQDIKSEISSTPIQPPITRFPKQISQSPSQIMQSQEVSEKPSYKKEIILLIILLILIGVLIATILSRERILAFFS